MCRVNSFCCGCSLEAGAITAAILTLLKVVSSVIGAGVYFSTASEYEIQQRDALAKEERIVGGLWIFIAILGTINFVCLVLAIKQHRATFCLPWLICTILQILIVAICLIISLVAKEFANLILIAGLAFWIYLWIVVWGFYLELKGDESGEVSL